MPEDFLSSPNKREGYRVRGRDGQKERSEMLRKLLCLINLKPPWESHSPETFTAVTEAFSEKVTPVS